MQDAAELLSVAGPNTLALVDELGKATSSADGLAFAWAVAEELLHTQALTLFATHFKELERLPHMYPTAAALHMEAYADKSVYQQTHTVRTGPCTETHYGLKLAKQVRAGLCTASVLPFLQTTCSDRFSKAAGWHSRTGHGPRIPDCQGVVSR